MTHLLPLSQPPIFAFQKGIAFGGIPLGFELGWSPEFHRRALDSLQSAMGTLVVATDPDVQRVRQSADRRYVADTAGAPYDFAFKRAEGESITGLLASTDPESFKLF